MQYLRSLQVIGEPFGRHKAGFGIAIGAKLPFRAGWAMLYIKKQPYLYAVQKSGYLFVNMAHVHKLPKLLIRLFFLKKEAVKFGEKLRTVPQSQKTV